VNQGDLIFTVCQFDRWLHQGDYYSEYDKLMVEEIRLMALPGLHKTRSAPINDKGLRV
jgi:ABC-type cobalamin transport system permease subunit